MNVDENLCDSAKARDSPSATRDPIRAQMCLGIFDSEGWICAELSDKEYVEPHVIAMDDRARMIVKNLAKPSMAEFLCSCW